jgi:hypothetical protein
MNLFTAAAYSLSAIVAKLTAFSVCAQQRFTWVIFLSQSRALYATLNCSD